jgi:thioredoxin reductase
MLLKSDGFASNLSAPLPDSTLADYCRSRELPYDATHLPVAVETFIAYGLDFQQRFVPQLEPQTVRSVDSHPNGYRVTLADGEELDARNVVVAAGITHFAYVPAVFGQLPESLVTHASAHHDVSRFAGRDVTVVGAGASAVELAVALAAVGAHSRLVLRASAVKFSSPPEPGPRPRIDRILQPSSGLGPGIRSRLCCDAPDLFRFLPGKTRAEIVRRHLGPSSPWHLREAFESSVEVMAGRSIRHAETTGEQVRLELIGDRTNGRPDEVATDHVICATGYHPDVRRLGFLDAGLRARIETVNDAPVLSSAFESSVPGLYFAGLAGAMTFGPLMRFMHGDEFAARRITTRIEKSRS